MSCRKLNRSAIFGFIFTAVVVMSIGCGQSPSNNAVNSDSQGASADNGGHNYLGWWCVAHGIPEEECSMCSAKFAAKCKEKGDWCEEHDRAESQCFVCHPELKDKFAAKFEAKFGDKPPEPSE